MAKINSDLVKPFRFKDLPILDVMWESINNPIRFIETEIEGKNYISTAENRAKERAQAVQLPEEYECIASRSLSKPDTLIGFYTNDTVKVVLISKIH